MERIFLYLNTIWKPIVSCLLERKRHNEEYALRNGNYLNVKRQSKKNLTKTLRKMLDISIDTIFNVISVIFTQSISHNVLNAHPMDTCLCRLVRDVSAGSSQRLPVSTYKHRLARDQPLLLYTALTCSKLTLWDYGDHGIFKKFCRAMQVCI